MAKFDVHRLGNGVCVVDCQSDHIRRFDTRLVIPLIAPGKDAEPIERLEPLVTFEADDLILTTHLLAAVPRHELGRSIGSLVEQRDAISAALDFLIDGF